MLDIIKLAECVVLYLYLPYRHKLFLRPISLLSNMFITIFTYGDVTLILCYSYGYVLLCNVRYLTRYFIVYLHVLTVVYMSIT